MSAIRDGSTELSAYRDGRLIHRSARHVIYTAKHPEDGSPVVIKMTAPDASPALVSALRHEFEILSRLDLPGVVQALDLVCIDDGLALLLAHGGSTSLRDHLAESGPLGMDAFLDLAVGLADLLAGLHAAQVIHRDLNPRNILIDPDSGRLTLIDFEMATSTAIVTPLETRAWELEGSLPYMSPEQTGRTGMAVDQRTDLYALGAICHELLSGSPPFVAADAGEMVNAHLACQPAPLNERHPHVPPLLAELVLKLLAKDPEARYQTARGVERDLRLIAEQLATTGGLQPFALGRFDRSATLRLSEKLHGREGAVDALGAAIRRVGQPDRALVLVTGEPGVGKSSLVGQSLPATRLGGGAIATGKFDQLQRSVPYADLAQAFSQLLQGLSSAPEQDLAGWRARLQDAVGAHGRLVAEVVPELLDLLGPQPSVEELEPAEARHRFHTTFARFAGALATPAHPLLIFLDDLQWADRASLALLATLAADPALPWLQIVGAYRDGEVGPDHPLALALADMARAGVAVTTLHLAPLAPDHVARLCEEALAAGTDDVRPLAALLHRVTAGNPFFIRQLLRAFVDAELLRFEAGEGRWLWDIGALERMGSTDSAVALMVQAIGRLPAASRDVLKVAASLGNRVALGMVATATGRSRTAAAHDLWPAVEAGLIHPLHDTYRAPRQAGPLDDRLAPLKAVYQFAHDQVQQAAYSLLDAAERERLHLRIGRLMRTEPAANLFETVDHLNLGAGLISDPTERLATAQLNLEAGHKAKASAAYAAALGYADAGMATLPPDAWATQAALSFDLHRLGAQSAYLSGDPGRAERLVAAALAHAPSLTAQADLYGLRIVAAATAGDHARALDLGREALALFGVDLAPSDMAEATAAEMAAVRAGLGARRVAELLDAPEVADAHVRACLRLLSKLYSPAYMTDQPLYALIAAKMVHLSVRHGRTVYSAESYVIYGLVLLGRSSENAETAFAFGNTAVAMARRYDSPAAVCKVLHVFATILNHWQAPLRTSIPLDREAFRAGLACGELQFAGFATFSIAFNLFDLGTPLDQVLQACDEGLAFGAKIGNKLVVDIQTAYRQAVCCLRGETSDPTRFDDGAFDEAAFLTQAQGAQLAVGLYEILRLRVTYWLGDQQAARGYAVSSAERLAYVPGVFARAEQVFYRGLNLAALLAEDPSAAHDARAAELAGCQAQLEEWARFAPENFAHKAALVAAERARVEGRALDAIRLYDQAIEGAEVAGFRQDEAVASELAGRFFLAQAQGRLARIHLRGAISAYDRWGARTKVTALRREFPTAAEPAAPTRLVPQAGLDTLSPIKATPARVEADRLKSELLSVVSHELRTPLAAIQGATTILRKGRAGALNTRQENFVGMIGDQTQRLMRMLDDLLDSQALEAGTLDFTPVRGDMAEVVRAAGDGCRAEMAAHGLTFELEPAAGPLETSFDRARIGQVLQHLLSNAAKFTPAGGCVRVRVYRRDGAIVTEVSDTGLGITPADSPGLFQPFHQLDMSAVRQAGGTGMGLFLSKAIIEAHGGALEVQSEIGRGSTFRFSLPTA